MLVSALFCFALPCMSAAPVEQVPTGYKVVRTEKLDELKSNNDKLMLKLAELEQKLALLKMPSNELVEQLAIAKQQLSVSKTALSDANSSLKNAESLLQQTQQSYQALERQLEAERTEQTRQNKKAYRKGWLNGFCIGFGSGVAVALFK